MPEKQKTVSCVSDTTLVVDWIAVEFIISVIRMSSSTKFTCLQEKRPKEEFLWKSCALFALTSVLVSALMKRRRLLYLKGWGGQVVSATVTFETLHLTFFSLTLFHLHRVWWKEILKGAIKLIFYTEGFFFKDTDKKTRGVSLSRDVLSKGTSDGLSNQ